MARGKKTDPAKRADKDLMDRIEAPETEGQDIPQEPEAAEQLPPQELDPFAKIPNPCVYCGPSVRGVARQYTTYQGGISDALREFIKAHPKALGLVVSTGGFPSMRKRLETPGTLEANLYKDVKEEL